ncbi:MAG: SRPBCC family protein [Bacteroidetes bacterium]|nr:SRPBCC family protein [Bacteroidota bacterium]MBS1939821.1 SRPBCC family protein [Bacteroidota bacterium]
MLYVLLILAVLIAGILILASTKPNTVHYERSTVINATPEKILPHITDFRKWMPWSPWEKVDPNLKRDYAGAASGVGAKYAWEGDKKAGTGTMEILEAGPDGVKIDLRFIKPWKAECIARFQFTLQQHATTVRWTMDGPNSFMGKVFGLFMNMDKLVGKDFEIGLAGLKTAVEKG